jgi:hypothetical protein
MNLFDEFPEQSPERPVLFGYDRLAQKKLPFDLMTGTEFDPQLIYALEGSFTLLVTPPSVLGNPLEIVFVIDVMRSGYVSIQAAGYKRLSKKPRSEHVWLYARNLGVAFPRSVAPKHCMLYLFWAALSLSYVDINHSHSIVSFVEDGACMSEWVDSVIKDGWKVERLVLVPARSRLDNI